MNQPQNQVPHVGIFERAVQVISAIAAGVLAVYPEESTLVRICAVLVFAANALGFNNIRTKVKRAAQNPFGAVILALLLLAASGAAQDGLPVVTIETSSGAHVAKWGEGGTVQAPHSIGGGFSSIDLPDGMGILLVTDGQDRPFKRIITDSYVVYTEGSRPLRGDMKGVEYIPDDAAAYRRGFNNELLGHEALPILFAHDRWLPPSDVYREAVLTGLKQTTHFEELADHPRTVALIQCFDDRHLARSTPFGATDLGWLIRHHDYTFGGLPRTGWYKGICPRGAGGYDNWHYDGLMWLALHYMVNPRPDLYRFGVQQAIAHACYGRNWSGPYAGFARYEKGNAFIGENYSEHDWAKQWSAGLIVWHRLTGNPILGLQVQLMREQLKASDPNTTWQGYWGARIGSHYLEELLAHYLVNREPWIVEKARQFMVNCKLWQLENGCWPNKGNGGTAEESPWMQVQLVTAIFRWLEHAPELREVWSPEDAAAAGAAIWKLGSQRKYGKPMLKYRFLTTEKLAPSMHLTAFAVPMLRFMAAHDPAKYGALYREVSDFVFSYAGTDIAGIVAETPTPISELGIRFPREGPGWSKALRFYLEARR